MRSFGNSTRVACTNTPFRSDLPLVWDVSLEQAHSSQGPSTASQPPPRPQGWGVGSTHHTPLLAGYGPCCTCPLLKKIYFPAGVWLVNKPSISLDFLAQSFIGYKPCISEWKVNDTWAWAGLGSAQQLFPWLQWGVKVWPVLEPGFTCGSGLDRGTLRSASPLWN